VEKDPIRKEAHLEADPIRKEAHLATARREGHRAEAAEDHRDPEEERRGVAGGRGSA
jgi:hypothetical protein